MFYEQYIELGGDVITPPQFKQDKNGRPYVEMWIAVTNNSKADNKVYKYRCFCWDGEVFRQLKQMRIATGDNLVVKGMFSLGEKQRVVHPKDVAEKIVNFFELRCYIKYVKMVSTQALRDAVNNKLKDTPQLQGEEGAIQNKQVNETSPVMLNISDEDNPY